MVSFDLLPSPPLYSLIPTATESLKIRVSHIEQNGNLGQHSARVHGHKFLEIIYCERDGGMHRVGTQQWQVQAGDLFFIAPYDIHEPRMRAERWVLQFTPDAIAPLAKESNLSWYRHPLLSFSKSGGMQSQYCNLVQEERTRWRQNLQHLKTELQLKRTGYKEVARAYLTLILIELFRLTTEKTDNNVPDSPILTQVFQIIEARYAEPISLVEVARAVGRSPAYLTTLVGRLTGRTVLEWLTERRMAEARRLLLETDENLIAICSRVGYIDTNSFIRLFRRLHGVTPGEWRRANR